MGGWVGKWTDTWIHPDGWKDRQEEGWPMDGHMDSKPSVKLRVNSVGQDENRKLRVSY